jgi:hypothetical protein
MPKPLEKPTPESIGSYVKKHASAVKKSQKHHGMGAASVREAEYNGHKIVIRTRYDVTVDGIPLMGHFGVSNDGGVHYHAIPNMRFDSAIDLVKQVIDVFPEDFKRGRRSHGGSMGPMGGMRGMRRGKRPSRGTKRA